MAQARQHPSMNTRLENIQMNVELIPTFFQEGKVVKGGKGTTIFKYRIEKEIVEAQGSDKCAVIQRIVWLDPMTDLATGKVEFRFCYYMREKQNATGAKRWKFGQSALFVPPAVLKKLLERCTAEMPGFGELVPVR